MYPFERFTERAKKVLTLAQQEAERSGHTYIGTEHLLLGLLVEAHGLGARALVNLGVDLDRARQAIDAALSRPEVTTRAGHIIPTSRVKRVIEIAFEEARRMGHNYVGTEHLLLGLLLEGEGIAANVLQDLGVTLDAARAEIERLLQAGPAESPTPQVATPPGRPPRVPSLSHGAGRILGRAHELAAEAGAAEVGVEHLELAIAEWRAQQQ
jgi:ATP-dependent Clp protease ATP-binding subunit ClpC